MYKVHCLLSLSKNIDHCIILLLASYWFYYEDYNFTRKKKKHRNREIETVKKFDDQIKILVFDLASSI